MKLDTEHMSDDERNELAAFADGSLAPADHSRVANKLAHSPELQLIVERQRATIRASVGIDVAAPAGLQERIVTSFSEAEVEPATERRWFGGSFRRPWLGMAGGLAVAILVAAIGIFALAGSTSPTVREAAELAERGPLSPPPAVNSTDPKMLAASVGGVGFPNYGDRFDWAPSGQRSDDLGDRHGQTVFYRRGDQQVAYSIVDGSPLNWPAEASSASQDGARYRQLRYDGRNVVTWVRRGHTCVISSEELSPEELLRLAAFEGGLSGSV